ncbi:hypothetical protein A2631_03290 [Candidatus Daviesbacteria bacterium RIFCSPHIGHO2_01_FULL_44_29]|uniref:Uncharacterized protein n=1 Tax=Candidatus Daviesbacteria bacterium RIFCSPHIGHO2_02_FULL_43_12 TaxID=1797776 RepID=A0A1F5KKE5_9BACT|nr:MAG: hypothetical protein A2631_03290 [Candidatus Daviesbacteria bacterium RIFCSPHIGHO2_01_FULL_44_29]OGE40293.1 MAG: hypothetical protein A3E86_03790 [Candidatus Daviesbacteria bacterium RIFCSPHIGHO2_12_FULL_47_45]OGE41407.1 MAG: hypothetical protein A3D25_02685 [Candidatus Daviesbacteria bacterium RIFCSPHIGHO2_02_FULL_43_12]OGE69607.1 MAG: hypothetical protein A3B55_04430 [Candidatus Daviesbacteria bacterium RIFCSPLOWO2_01_FULL_43_15]
MEDFAQITRDNLLKNIVTIFFVILISASLVFQFFGLINCLGFLAGAIILGMSFFIWSSVLSVSILSLHQKMMNKERLGIFITFRITMLSILVFTMVMGTLYLMSLLLFSLSSKLFLILGALLIYLIVLQNALIKLWPFIHINYIVSLSEEKIKKILSSSLVYQQVLMLQKGSLLKLLETLIIALVLMVSFSLFLKIGWPFALGLLGVFIILGFRGALAVSKNNRTSLLLLSSVSEYSSKKVNLLKNEARLASLVNLFFTILTIGGSSLYLSFFMTPFLGLNQTLEKNFFNVINFASLGLFGLLFFYALKIFTNRLSEKVSIYIFGFLKRVRLFSRKNKLNLLSLVNYFEQKNFSSMIILSLLSIAIVSFIRVATFFLGMNIILNLLLMSILLMGFPVLFNVSVFTERLLAVKKDDFWEERRQGTITSKIFYELTLRWSGYYLWVLTIFGAIFSIVWRI